MRRIFFVLLAAVLVVFSTFSVSTEDTNVFMKNSSAKGKVALTFDDGPHPRYTPAILDILEEYGIKATFFVIGRNVENYPEAFKTLLASDCEIGNHTYTHGNVGIMSGEEISRELEKTEQAIARISPFRPYLFRPPEGACGSEIERVSRERGYDIVLWSIDTLDWAHTPSETIAKKILANIGDGDIILMHDYVSRGNTTLGALRLIIPELLARGYEFVTVSELLGEE